MNKKNKMDWCIQVEAHILFLLCFMGFCFSLGPDQINIMNNLSKALNVTKQGDPCQWDRVTCNQDNTSVTKLSLSGLSLIDPADVFPDVCKIDSLEELDVSNNQLGSFPDRFLNACGAISKLKLLNFSRNKLAVSLPSFADYGFEALECLDLSYNLLQGSIDMELAGLVKLRSLNLSVNSFTGALPVKLGRYKVLEELELSANRFEGQIPAEIADYKSLKRIDLSGNQLYGQVPADIAQLPKLEVLILSSNKLNGPIPDIFGSLTLLFRFSANQNQFTSPIPRGITKYLKNLDVSYNRLAGSIPSDLLSPQGLQFVDLSYNQLDGVIPNDVASSMFRLRLGGNRLTGLIPPNALQRLSQLTYLELENNSLNGTIPPELGLCQNLALLNLAQNNLGGSIPPELGNLIHLQVLKLQLNRLSGVIPVEIMNLTTLSQLNVSWNLLSGSIPPSISNLRNLTILNLQNNNLTGSIPESIGRLESLLELNLGKNQLTGPVPIMPGNLQISLNLSSNLFEGEIPDTLSRLTNLEILDLSNNKFSGSIPSEFTQMTSLALLILSNNQLNGSIPQFSHHVEIEFDGNQGLHNTTTLPTSMSRKRNSIAMAILLAVGSAIVVAVIAAAAFVSISRRYYRVNDEQLQSREDLPIPQVIQDSLLTANGIHRSNIDFGTAMQSVIDPSKVVLKTRFSTYYKATMPSGVSYYIKKLNWSDKIFQLGSHDRFEQELDYLGKLNNSNIMTPLAYVLTIDSAYVFYEYAEKGTLYDVLHGSTSVLDWASRYSLAVGVAHGLAFLHDCPSGPILLLDLSSRSIMLKSLKEPQVGDIELCKVIDPSKSTGSLSTIAGSVGFIPPEYAYTMRITTAGNVYSFGVVLLELLTGKPAVSEGTELAKWVLTNCSQHGKWDRILDSSVSRTSPAVRSQMLAVLKVAHSCVRASPEVRPKMKSVLTMLLNAR